AVFEAGIGIKHIGQLHHQTGVQLQSHGGRKFLDAAPTGSTVDEALWTANDGDATVSELMEVFECEAAAGFIVHHNGTDEVAGERRAVGGGGDFALIQIGEHVNVDEQPVGNHDQGVDVPLQEHFQIALKALALFVSIGKNRKIT